MMHGYWDTEWGRQCETIFCHFGPCFTLLPPWLPRKSKLWKIEKKAWKYDHFTQVYHKQSSYDVWFLRHGMQQTDFFVILNHFLPFHLPNNLENQNFEKKKNEKKPADIIILQMCTLMTITSCMVSEIWSVTDRIFCCVGPFFFFCPFTPLTTLKIKILKRWKNPLEKFSRYTHVYHKWMIIISCLV